MLETIQSLMPTGKSVEDFGIDTLAEGEIKWREEWDGYTDEEKDRKKQEWGMK